MNGKALGIESSFAEFAGWKNFIFKEISGLLIESTSWFLYFFRSI